MPESLTPTITSVGGGFFTGILVDYFVKKIFKILRFVAGGLAVLLYLQQQQIMLVNILKLQNSLTFTLNSAVFPFDNITQTDDTTFLGFFNRRSFSGICNWSDKRIIKGEKI